jgi:hypothetical protein
MSGLFISTLFDIPVCNLNDKLFGDRDFRSPGFRNWPDLLTGMLLCHHHVFHPRDLYFLNSSINFLKYCFSCNLNSLFMCVRSFFESCLNQY